MPKSLTQLQDKKVGLVLSGGIVRAAAWHLGVCYALDDLGFQFPHHSQERSTEHCIDISTIVGSSAGGLIGVFLSQGLTPQEIIDAVLGKNKYIKKLRYRDMLYLKRPKLKTLKADFFSPYKELPLALQLILKTANSMSGFFSTEGLKKYLLTNIIQNDLFEDLALDLFIIGTQLDHSRKVIFSKYNYPNPGHDSTANYYTGYQISDAVSASMAVPPFYTPYPIMNPLTQQVDHYIDGEIRETLSTHVAIDNHCDVVISSWTHTPYHYHDEIGSLAHYGIPAIITQSLYLMIQKKIVSHRAQLATSKDIIDTVFSYMKSEKFNTKHQNDIIKILEKKLNYRQSTKLIDIFPDHNDYDLFFTNSFSLDPKRMESMMRKGYKKTIEVFNRAFD